MGLVMLLSFLADFLQPLSLAGKVVKNHSTEQSNCKKQLHTLADKPQESQCVKGD